MIGIVLQFFYLIPYSHLFLLPILLSSSSLPPFLTVSLSFRNFLKVLLVLCYVFSSLLTVTYLCVKIMYLILISINYVHINKQFCLSPNILCRMTIVSGLLPIDQFAYRPIIAMPTGVPVLDCPWLSGPAQAVTREWGISQYLTRP